MTTYNGIPIFDLDIIDGIHGVDIISLVDYPAIERDFIKLSKETEVKFSINEEKRIVSGPALIPDKPIYRRDENGREFYVKFSEEAIRRIAEKFFADHNTTNVNLQHEIDVDGCVYFESYFIDRKRGIVPADFADLPDGTWIVSAKINNPAVWELVKDGTLRGFSIEGTLNMVTETPKEDLVDTIEDLLSRIKG